MATSQRLSRGFNRLGLLLAALAFVVLVPICLYFANQLADQDEAKYAKEKAKLAQFVCVREKMGERPPAKDNYRIYSPEAFGCPGPSILATATAIWDSDPPRSRTQTFATFLAMLLGMAAIAVGTLYALVRAIGWVIGGFAAS